jgi:hypothetical protein
VKDRPYCCSSHEQQHCELSNHLRSLLVKKNAFEANAMQCWKARAPKEQLLRGSTRLSRPFTQGHRDAVLLMALAGTAVRRQRARPGQKNASLRTHSPTHSRTPHPTPSRPHSITPLLPHSLPPCSLRKLGLSSTCSGGPALTRGTLAPLGCQRGGTWTHWRGGGAYTAIKSRWFLRNPPPRALGLAASKQLARRQK